MQISSEQVTVMVCEHKRFNTGISFLLNISLKENQVWDFENEDLLSLAKMKHPL